LRVKARVTVKPMQKRYLITATAVLLSLPLVLNAADEKKKGGGFGAMDTDKDGKVSKAEFMKAMDGKGEAAKTESRFKSLDANNDGFLTAEEFAAGQKKKEKKS
jgi:Ca2+-binding EF-hand superfamily protein